MPVLHGSQDRKRIADLNGTQLTNSTPNRSRLKDEAETSREPTARGSHRDQCFRDGLEALVLSFSGVVAGGHSVEWLRVSSALSREFAGQPCVGDYRIVRRALEPPALDGSRQVSARQNPLG